MRHDGWMRFGSVCSGIEAVSCAWNPLGFTAQWLAEIATFPRAVTDYHYPKVPNFGDFTKIGSDAPGIDVLVGGTPCQSFSLSGLRKGLADDRGNLALEFLRLVDRTRPQWVVWENVLGVLSSTSHDAPDPSPPPPPVDMERDGQTVETDDEYGAEESHAFNCFLAGLSELGYGWSYRVLNSEHFGLAQRRQRVFVVGCLGNVGRPENAREVQNIERAQLLSAAVLFERYSLSGNSPPSREKGKDVAGPLTASASGGFGYRAEQAAAGHVVAHGMIPEISPALKARDRKGASSNGTGDGAPLIPVGSWPADVACTIDASYGRLQGQDNQHVHGGAQLFVPAVFDEAQITSPDNRSSVEPGAPSPTLSSTSRLSVIAEWGVRRLTPREFERLQGFPDDYTLVPFRGKPAADGPRYEALGNSMAVPVVRWIGERLLKVEEIRRRL